LFLLFSLAFLATAVSKHPGGGWLGEVGLVLRSEAHADLASIKEDVHAIHGQAQRTPKAVKSFWGDLCRYVREVEADAAEDARIAGERISTLVKTT
jgi:hypothetical protein